MFTIHRPVFINKVKAYYFSYQSLNPLGTGLKVILKKETDSGIHRVLKSPCNWHSTTTRNKALNLTFSIYV